MSRTSRVSRAGRSRIAAWDTRSGRRGPAAEQALRHRRDVEAGEVAADDERGRGRVHAPFPGRTERGRVEGRDGRLQAAGRPVVRRVGRVDRVDERLLGATPRVRPRLEDIVEPLVAQALDLRVGERRPADHLGQQLDGGLEALARDLDAGRHRVPARLGVEGRTESLGGLDEGDRVVVLGPLGQGPGGQDGRPGGLGRLVDRAVPEHERGGDERAGRPAAP